MDPQTAPIQETHPENMQTDLNQPSVLQTQTTTPNYKKYKKIGYLVILLSVFMLFMLFAYLYMTKKDNQTPQEEQSVKNLEIKKFSTDEEFKNFLTKTTSSAGYFGTSSLRTMEMAPQAVGAPGGAFANIGSSDLMYNPSPDRISETNVQVSGIDEPDILKTDGVNVFFANTFGGVYPMPFIDRGISVEEDRLIPNPTYNTKVIKAFPPSEISKISDIPENGEMLLFDKTLFTYSGNKFSGYDVSDPVNPKRSWTKELEGNTQIASARKYNDKLYLITATYIYTSSPCPIPLVKGEISITCTDIYYPPSGNSSDATFTLMVINPVNGVVENKATFLAKSGQSVIYMSENYVYISFTFYESYVNLIINFLKSEGSGFISPNVIADLEKIAGYDISEESKMNELTRIFESYMASLTDDEKKKLENEMQNKAESYMETHARDLEKTGIARFSTGSLDVSSSETIPGSPLNQFSLDEYQGNLRIATTTSNSLTGSGKSFNDVYVLDKDLRITGSITDLGISERIYSARFIEDKGYLVTFRQIDPFYVLDLSDPKNPEMKGELKIPGYSSYLHPLEKNLILGVGMEGSNAKVSLFDVSDASDPKEISKYDISEYWSDVSSNHHAFLQDSKHGVFFMPAGQNGYIFSYQGKVIDLKRVVTGTLARRALYLDDYFYIFGDSKMVVLDEKTWEDVTSYDYQ